MVLLDLVLLHHASRFRRRLSTVQIAVRWQVSWIPVLQPSGKNKMLALYRIFFFTCCIKISKIHVVYVSVSVGREDCSDCSRGHFNICKQISTFPIIHINEKLGTVTSRSFPVPSHVVFIVSKPIQTVCTLLSQHEIELNDRTVKFRHPLIFIWFAEMNSASISSGNQL